MIVRFALRTLQLPLGSPITLYLCKSLVSAFFLLVVLGGVQAQTSYGQQVIQGKYNGDAKSFTAADSSYWVGTVVDGRAYLYRDGYVGLIDSSGRVLVPPMYDKIFAFDSGGIANVTRNGKYGLIDINGNVVATPFSSFYIGPFTDGYGPYKTSRNIYGIVDRKGKVVMPASYHALHYIQGGQFIAVKGNAYSLLTPSTGKVVDVGTNATIRSEDHQYELIRWGYYDSAPQLQYNERSAPFLMFVDGLAVTYQRKGDVFLFGCIDRTGEMVIPAVYEWIEPFRDSVAVVRFQSKWGAINREGDLVVPAEYDSITAIGGNRFVIGIKGRFGIVRSNNSQVIPLAYNRVVAAGNDRYIVSTSDKHGVVDNDNNTIIPAVYDSITVAGRDRYIVWQGERAGIVVANNGVVIPPTYRALYPLLGDLFIACDSVKYGVIDMNERVVVPFQCDAIVPLDSKTGVAFVHTGNWPLHTGIPRYQWNGVYFYFDKGGRVDSLNYPHSYVVEGQADNYHLEFPVVFGPRYFARVDTSALLHFYTARQSLPRLSYPKGVMRVWHLPGTRNQQEHYLQNIGQSYSLFNGGYKIAQPLDDSSHLNHLFGEAPAASIYGVADLNGQVVLPPEYDNVECHSSQYDPSIPNNLFLVTKNQMQGVVDINNRVILPCEYSIGSIAIYSGVILRSRHDGSNRWSQSVLDLNGNVLIPFPDTTDSLKTRITVGDAGELVMTKLERVSAYSEKEVERYLVDKRGNRIPE